MVLANVVARVAFARARSLHAFSQLPQSFAESCATSWWYSIVVPRVVKDFFHSNGSWFNFYNSFQVSLSQLSVDQVSRIALEARCSLQARAPRSPFFRRSWYSVLGHHLSPPALLDCEVFWSASLNSNTQCVRSSNRGRVRGEETKERVTAVRMVVP